MAGQSKKDRSDEASASELAVEDAIKKAQNGSGVDRARKAFDRVFKDEQETRALVNVIRAMLHSER
jgi:hypothetical protein